MKVFFVNSTKTWGGGEKWHFEMADALRKAGYDVTMLAREGKDLYKRSLAANIRTLPIVITNLSFSNPFRLWLLFRFFRNEKPDAVILNFSADVKAAGFAAHCAGVRHIIYRRGSAIPIRNTFLNRLLYKKVITAIIANSFETRRTILHHNSRLFPADQIAVIYNGIQLDQFDSMPSEPMYQRQKDEVIIGNAGRLVFQKGQHYLVDMALMLKKKAVNFKILIAGEGPLEESLREMAVNAGVADHMVFLGFVGNIKAFMENIDIFVLTSVWEGFGYVLVEAMACQKPVVAFNISSNPEIVAADETGYLIDNFDMHAMTEKIETLIQQRNLAEKFGQAGRKRVEAVFDLRKTQQQVERLLHRLHKGQPLPETSPY
jgi:glycosyltransferase involved in cell wall biosynthesis